MPNAMQRIMGRIREMLTTSSNVMSRQVRVATRRIRSLWRQPTHDWSRADYRFWRDAYYGRARGLELSGLFLKPIISKVAAWTLGRAPEWRCDSEASQEALTQWWNGCRPQVLQGYRAALRQGDAFIVVNSDLSLTIVRPDSVDPLVAADDYSRIIGWRVTQVLDHPTELRRMTTVDEYYPDRRAHRIEIDGRAGQETVYPNLLGRLPIVHIANSPQDGETFGHAEAEGLIEVLHRYGEVFEAAIEGNITQGRPTPYMNFETQADLEKFWALYGSTKSVTRPDGSAQQVTSLVVDLSQVLTTSGATFDYKSPAPFTEDTGRLLEFMFYLILEHSELPEFVMGNAIASSKASAETQMPVFEKFVEGKRGEIGGWLTELAEIALGYLALTEPGIVAETPTLQWQKLTQDARMTLDTLVWAYAEGLLDRRTALLLAPIDVGDVDAVLDAAEAEMVGRTPPQLRDEKQFDEDLEAEIENLEI